MILLVYCGRANSMSVSILILFDEVSIVMTDKTLENCEFQYLPSRWVKRCDPEQVIHKHVDFIRKESATTQATVPCELNISYGSLERQKIDIFGSDLPNDVPIFIYIHGGYWQELSREESSYVVKPLYNNNIKVIIIGYNLCPDVTIKAIQQEISQSLLYCLHYAEKCNSRGLYLCGHSAGAHLACSFFVNTYKTIPLQRQQIIKATFLISGIFDLIPLINTSINSPLKLDFKAAKELSPMFNKIAATGTFKFYIIVAEEDSPAFQNQARQLYNKIIINNPDSQLISVNNRDHFNIIESLNDENDNFTQFIINSIMCAK